MHDIALRKVVYQLPNMENVCVQSNIPYDTKSNELNFDLYLPLQSKQPFPVVIFVFGFSDPMFGKGLKQMEQYKCWAKLMATKGIGAITYNYINPEQDVKLLLDYLDENAELFGLDENNMAIWACSGNAPLGLSLLFQKSFKCAAFLYGYMIDNEGSNDTTNAATQFGFVNPHLSKSINEIKTPIFLIRAGKDQMPNLNKTIDKFVLKSIEYNLPIMFCNYATGEHAFDLYNNDLMSQEIIRDIIDFFQFHLYPQGPDLNDRVSLSGDNVG